MMRINGKNTETKKKKFLCQGGNKGRPQSGTVKKGLQPQEKSRKKDTRRGVST
jgi:hypothetical protein